jgi:hypothetical protein
MQDRQFLHVCDFVDVWSHTMVTGGLAEWFGTQFEHHR